MALLLALRSPLRGCAAALFSHMRALTQLSTMQDLQIKMFVFQRNALLCCLLFTSTGFLNIGAAELSIPQIDLNDQKQWQVVVDREPGRYLGHPSTVLLEDGKTILCVYPEGHGRGAIRLKRSQDGGLTWSKPLPLPDNWKTSRETPTIHRVIDAVGKKRLIVWSGLYPARLAVSEDDGNNWTPLAPVENWGGIVVMGSLEPVHLQPGHYLGWFHDDGRYIRTNSIQEKPIRFSLYQVESKDGGLSWSEPRILQSSSEIHLCEPGVIRSPDGKKLAMLLRENSRRKNAHIMFSTDEGLHWSEPRELPEVFTGDRHVGKYSRDGRLLISFRDTKKDSASFGDWVAWVGHYHDLENGTAGDYRVRLKHNTKAADCAYPGVEVLPDGTFILITYGHWIINEPPFILCVRLKELPVTATQWIF